MAPSLPSRPFKLSADAVVVGLGQQAFADLKGKIPRLADARTEAHVGCVMRFLAGDTTDAWEVALFEEPGASLFALPGSKVGIYRGIFAEAQNQHQLAAAIAHVMTHVSLQHLHERVSQQPPMAEGVATGHVSTDPDTRERRMSFGALGITGQGGVVMPFSRLQESEADFVALDRMAIGGFDPRQAVEFWNNMNRFGGGPGTNFLATHPLSASRLEDMQSHMPIAMELRQRAIAAGKKPTCD